MKPRQQKKQRKPRKVEIGKEAKGSQGNPKEAKGRPNYEAR